MSITSLSAVISIINISNDMKKHWRLSIEKITAGIRNKDKDDFLV